MIDFGTVRPGTTLYIPFATYDSNDPTASVTMTGLATSDIEIYKDGGTTQRGSDAGYALLDTDGTDFDGVTGIHGLSIALADNTTAGFYAAGSQYWVVVSSVTIDAGTINFIAATFRIGYPDGILNTTIATLASQTSFTLTAGPADDNALIGCVALIHDVASAVQMAIGVVSAYTGSSRTVTLAADPAIFTMAAADNIAFYLPVNTRWMTQTALTGRDIGASVLLSAGTGTGQLDIASGKLAWNAAWDAEVESEVDDALGGGTGTALTAIPWNAAWDAEVESEVDDALGGGTGTALTAIPWNAAWDAEVQSEATDALNAYDPPTNAEMEARTLVAADYVVVGDTLAAVTTVGSVTGSVGSVTGNINTAAGTIQTLDALDTAQDVEHDATQALIGAIGSGTGAALNFAVSADNASSPIKTISSIGTPTGTYANTLADDGTTHQIASVEAPPGTHKIDWIYGFSCGAGRSAAKIVLRANLGATGDTLTVQAHNFITPGWDTRTTFSGTTEILRDIPLLASHTGTGADEGKVYIRFVFSESDAGTLVVDEAYVQAQQSGSLIGYSNGAIWVNTAASNTNTVPYVDGTADNPVSTWAAALTLSGTTGLTRFEIDANSSITLTGDSTGYEFNGNGLFSLALGGQDISNAYIRNAAVSGTGTGSNTIFEDCRIDPGASCGPAYFIRSGFATTSGSPFVAASAGSYVFVDCVSLGAGVTPPYFDFTVGSGSTYVNFRRWDGGNNIVLDSTCTMAHDIAVGGVQTINCGGASTVDVRGITESVALSGITSATTSTVSCVTGPITLAGADGTVNVYGVCASVTDNRTGSPTLNNLANYANVTQISGDSTAADRLEAMLDAMPTGTVVDDNDPDPTTLLFETNLTEATDNHYNGGFVVFSSGALLGQSRKISDYDGTTKVLTVASAFTEAPTAGDTFVILGRSE